MNNEKGDVMSKVLALKILGGFAAAGVVVTMAGILVSPAFGGLVATGICGGVLVGGSVDD